MLRRDAQQRIVGHADHSGPLDADHLGAMVGQHHRRERPRPKPGHLDDFQSCKRARHAFGLAPNRRAARGAGVRNGKGLRAFRHPSGGTFRAFDDDGTFPLPTSSKGGFHVHRPQAPAIPR